MCSMIKKAKKAKVTRVPKLDITQRGIFMIMCGKRNVATFVVLADAFEYMGKNLGRGLYMQGTKPVWR